MVFRSAAHATPPKGVIDTEKLLNQGAGPQVIKALPASLRKETRVPFDVVDHDLYGAGLEVLQSAGPVLGIFPEDDSVSPLEKYRLHPSSFKRHQARRSLYKAVAQNARFLAAYDKLLQEVVIPHMKAVLLANGEAAEPHHVFYYQRPPTMRVQPPSSETGARHRDAEYGHQDGEVNFWLPLTDYALTQTALWVESAEGVGDFHPLDAEYGTMVAFHGTSCWHEVPANLSQYTRVSLDFRVGVEQCFDPQWLLNGTRASHNYQRFAL
mmetsp:Transcript_24436/g.44841  ORF Transcript_24436/g.44841 Transcript_24436/m.44841 type:complete len:267 (-) Transcript_24436:18-818(-)